MNKSFNIKNIIVIIIILILTATVALNLDSNPFSEVLAQHDSSMFTYFGYAMKNGKIMYTEIFDHKGPMIFIFNYIGALIDTPLLNGIFIVEISMVFSYFLLAYKVARKWLNKPMSLLQLVPQAIILPIYFSGGNFTELYALPFIAYGILAFTSFAKGELKAYELIISGVSFSIVFLLRANMIAFWLAFWSMLFVFYFIKKQYKPLMINIGYFMLGISIVFVPIIIYLLINNALEAAIFQSLIMNFMYVDSVENKLEGVLELFKMLQIDYLTILIAIFVVVLLAKFKKLSIREMHFYIGIIIFFILSFIFSMISGRAYAHYLIVMVPTMIVPMAYLFSLITENKKTNGLGLISLLLIGCIYFSQLNTLYSYAYRRNITSTIAAQPSDGYDYAIYNENKNKKYNEIAQIIKTNTKENDEIYAHRLGGLLYLLSDRTSSIKYFNLPAIDINKNLKIGNDFIKEIINADTELIILSTNYKNSKENGEIDKEFLSYVQGNYNVIHEDETYTIYKKM